MRKNIFTVDADYYSASLFEENIKEPFVPMKLIKQLLLLCLVLIGLFFAYNYIFKNMQTINRLIAEYIPIEDSLLEQNSENFSLTSIESEKIEKVLRPVIIEEQEVENVASKSLNIPVLTAEKMEEHNYLVDDYIEEINKIISE